MDDRAEEDVFVEIDVVLVDEEDRLSEEVYEEERLLRKEAFFDSKEVAGWLNLIAVQLLQLDDIVSFLDHLDCLQDELVSNGLQL